MLELEIFVNGARLDDAEGRDSASPTFSLLNIPVSLEEEVEPQSRWRFTYG
jgi:hypothetical protein